MLAMKYQLTWRKLMSSLPGIAIFQSVTALSVFLFVLRPSHTNSTNVAIFCIFYGIVSAIVIKAYAARYAHSLGLKNHQQVYELASAVKSTRVPIQVEVKKALPAYLDKRLNSVQQQRKTLPYNFAIIGFLILLSALTRNLASILALQAKLGIKGAQPLSEAEQEKQRKLLFSKAKSYSWISGVVLLVVAIPFVAHSSNKADNKSGKNDIATYHAEKLASPPVFTVSRYNFKVEFPGKPTATDYAFQSVCDANPLTYTLYTSTANNDTEVYTLYALPWPKHVADFDNMSEEALRSALQNFIRNDLQAYNATQDGVPVELSEYGTVPGKRTLVEEVKFTIPRNKSTTPGYLRVFTAGNTEYDLMGEVPEGKAAFENFANSFSYTGHASGMADNAKGTVNLSCLNPTNDSPTPDINI
jgi:hypothetical protein